MCVKTVMCNCMYLVHCCLAYVPSDLFSVSAVMKELSVLQKKWKIIGEELGVMEYLLDDIRTDYSKPENRLWGVLSVRVRNQPTSWGDIITVLRTPRVGQSQLADQLQDKYCPSELANLQHSKIQHCLPIHCHCVNGWYCSVLAKL